MPHSTNNSIRIQRFVSALLVAAGVVFFILLVKAFGSMVFYSDDIPNIRIAKYGLWEVFSRTTSDASPIPAQYFRPAAWFMAWLKNAIGLESAPSHYIVNLLMHLANTLLLYFLIKQRPTERTSPSGVRVLPVAASLAFFCGFIPAFSLTWISQWFDLQATLFALAGIFFARSYWLDGKRGSFIIALICFTVSMLSKEIGGALVALIPVLYHFDKELWKSAQRHENRIVRITFSTIAIVAGVLLARAVLGIPSALPVFANIASYTSALVWARSYLELVQPFRSISWATGNPSSVQTAVMAIVACVFLIPWVALFIQICKWKKLRKSAFLSFVIVTIPLLVYAVMGWVHPRLLYLPFALLVLTTASIVNRFQMRSEITAGIPYVYLALIGAVFSFGIVSYFHRIGNYNKTVAYALSVPHSDSTWVITQEFNRFWHESEGRRLFPILYSEADPLYEWCFTDAHSPRFTVRRLNDTAFVIKGLIPNRYFQLQNGTWTSHSKQHATIRQPGYIITVLRTALDNRPVEVSLEFTERWLHRNRLYVDDGYAFTRIDE